MSDSPTNPFELMMKQAQDMAKAMNPAMESFSPKGFEALWPTMPKEVMEMMFGNAVNTEGLDAKTRLLLTLAGAGAFTGRQDTRTPLKVSVAGAVANLVIELILIPGLGYGIGAAAVSTVLAQIGTGSVGHSADPDDSAHDLLERIVRGVGGRRIERVWVGGIAL